VLGGDFIHHTDMTDADTELLYGAARLAVGTEYLYLYPPAELNGEGEINENLVIFYFWFNYNIILPSMISPIYSNR